MRKILKKTVLMAGMVAAFIGLTGFKSVSGDGKPSNWDIDNEQFIYDYADVFTDGEEEEIQEKCEELGKELGLDIIIVSTRNLTDEKKSNNLPDSTIDRLEREYAEGFYLEGLYDDGILYLIDEQYGGMYITRSGMGEVYISDADFDDLFEKVWEEFADYDYYDSAMDFIGTVDDIVGPRIDDDEFEELAEAWKRGEYQYYDEFYADYKSKINEAHNTSFFELLRSPLVSGGIALIIALISVLIMAISSSTKMTAGSRDYMEKGSLRILHRYDRFVRTTTETRKIETSSGSGGGGGSSSHRSGGRSFSGGGRRR